MENQPPLFWAMENPWLNSFNSSWQFLSFIQFCIPLFSVDFLLSQMIWLLFRSCFSCGGFFQENRISGLVSKLLGQGAMVRAYFGDNIEQETHCKRWEYLGFVWMGTRRFFESCKTFYLFLEDDL